MIEGSGQPGRRAAQGGADRGVPPNLVVIGAMKCGTSSLHYYLDLHPEISMSTPKELNFLLDTEPAGPGIGSGELPLMREDSEHWRGTDWYLSHFRAASPVRGESSVSYSFPWYRSVAGRLHELAPQARLIYVLRHPLERALSHHRQLATRDHRPAAEALAAPGNPYIGASRYATALGPFLERFPREQLLLLRRRDLLERRGPTLAEIFRFLGVDKDFWDERFERERNRTAAKGRAYDVAERVRAGPLAPVARRVPAGARAAVERRLSRPGEAPPARLDRGLAERLLADLEDEIAAIERLSGWRLEEWRRPPEPS